MNVMETRRIRFPASADRAGTAATAAIAVIRSAEARTGWRTMTAEGVALAFIKHAFAISRHDLPELCRKNDPRMKRARGMPGAQCTRSLVCAL
jgi:hypothetical protein